MAQKKLSGQTATYLVLFGAGLVAFIFLAIYPQYRHANQLDRQIWALKQEIQTQKTLHPYYKSLLARSRQGFPEGLSPTKQTSLERKAAGRIATALGDLARSHRLKVVAITPELGSLVSDTGMMQVDLDLEGDFRRLHRFLSQVAALPYLIHIEEVAVAAIEKAQKANFRIWLARG